MSDPENFLKHTRFSHIDLENCGEREIHVIATGLFNDGFFWEAHEVWEEIWQSETGDTKRFIQALILFAGGLLHASNDNAGGMERLIQKGLNYSKDKESEAYRWGVDLEKLHQDMEHFLSYAKNHQPFRLKGRRPKIHGQCLSWEVKNPKATS
jgi:predicted metal-dependent hydrolase